MLSSFQTNGWNKKLHALLRKISDLAGSKQHEQQDVSMIPFPWFDHLQQINHCNAQRWKQGGFSKALIWKDDRDMMFCQPCHLGPVCSSVAPTPWTTPHHCFGLAGGWWPWRPTQREISFAKTTNHNQEKPLEHIRLNHCIQTIECFKKIFNPLHFHVRMQKCNLHISSQLFVQLWKTFVGSVCFNCNSHVEQWNHTLEWEKVVRTTCHDVEDSLTFAGKNFCTQHARSDVEDGVWVESTFCREEDIELCDCWWCVVQVLCLFLAQWFIVKQCHPSRSHVSLQWDNSVLRNKRKTPPKRDKKEKGRRKERRSRFFWFDKLQSDDALQWLTLKMITISPDGDLHIIILITFINISVGAILFFDPWCCWQIKPQCDALKMTDCAMSETNCFFFTSDVTCGLSCTMSLQNYVLMPVPLIVQKPAAALDCTHFETSSEAISRRPTFSNPSPETKQALDEWVKCKILHQPWSSNEQTGSVTWSMYGHSPFHPKMCFQPVWNIC